MKMASVKRRDNGSYRVRWRDETGASREKSFARKVDADRHAAFVTADLARGTYVDVAAGRAALRDVAEAWRAAQPHRPGSARLIERQLRLHIYPTLGDRQIGQVRRSDVQALATGLAQRLAPATVSNTIKTLSAVMNSAVADGLIPNNPVRRISMAPVERRDVLPLTIDQVLEVAGAIQPRYRALVLLAAGTGLRQGECLGLTAERVDFLRREVNVVQQLVDVPGTPVHLGSLKTPSSRRVVPVPDAVLAELSHHMATYPPGPHGVLFTSTVGGTVNRTSLHRSWALALSKAGLPAGTHFHDLRHSYVSMLIEGGESVVAVARRVGHKDATETLKTYSHLFGDSAEKTRRVVDDAFAAAVEQSVTATR